MSFTFEWKCMKTIYNMRPTARYRNMYVRAGSSKKMSAATATATAAHKTWIFNSTSTATFTVNFDLPF